MAPGPAAPAPATGPPFVADAALTDAELEAAAARSAERGRAVAPGPAALPATLVGMAVALAGAGAAVALGVATLDDGFVVALLLLLAYAGGLAAMARTTAAYQRAALRAQRDSTSFPRERRSYRIGADGIRVAGPTARAAWTRRALTEAEEHAGLLLFWVGHAHGFAVPARGFAGGAAEAGAALAFARARIAAARPAVRPATPPPPP